MKIIVFADSHRRTEPMERAVREERPDAIIHLGDNEGDAAELGRKFPTLPMYSVCGNCDFLPTEPRRIITDLCGVRLFITHGHDYGVKYGYDAAVNTAMAAGADVLLFGHTHSETYFETGGLTVINPGSVAGGSHPYGVLILKDGRAEYTQKYAE